MKTHAIQVLGAGLTAATLVLAATWPVVHAVAAAWTG
jgi:hypothetical protein